MKKSAKMAKGLLIWQMDKIKELVES